MKHSSDFLQKTNDPCRRINCLKSDHLSTFVEVNSHLLSNLVASQLLESPLETRYPHRDTIADNCQVQFR